MAMKMYWIETKWRFFYACLTFFFSFFIIILFIDVFFLFEAYPLIVLHHKKFMATHITELFTSVFLVCLFFTYLIIFPSIAYHCLFFLSSSFYPFQIAFLKRCIFFIFLIAGLAFLITYHLILPNILFFFLQWKTHVSSLSLELELDTRIKEYLYWVNSTYSILNLSFQTFMTLPLLLLFLYSTAALFNHLKFYRRHWSFIILFWLYLILPPDLILQLLLFIFIFCFFECFFYISCFRLKQIQISW